MENNAVRALEPQALWNHFADINAIPRGSKKEEKIIAYMVEFGKKLGLETLTDPTGNVIIKKPATPGMENRKAVVLQSHLDMVHQKNSDTQFDFDKQGIQMLVEGDWVKAKGTTLGADNGLGVAAIMSVLASKNMEHPAVEALFTIDEETGMTGAMGLQPGYLNGEILLNLDTEEDDEIDIGCAGGIDVTASAHYSEESVPEAYIGLRVSVTGLQGGHSGMDIHRGLGNANKIMNRILRAGGESIRLARLQGGSLRNAIPRESFCVVACPEGRKEEFLEETSAEIARIKGAFSKTDPNLSIMVEAEKCPEKMMGQSEQEALIRAIEDAVNGVYKMSEEMPDLVEASNNIAKINAADGTCTIECLTRSSVEESKMEVANSLKKVFESAGYTVRFSGAYPGWSPNRDSPILKVLVDNYSRLYKSKPSVVACHAGLECGILGTHYPDMDMISFGPTIKGAHSPDERASISSAKRFWNFLQEILNNIPLQDD